jgi:hypothetical protein
MTSPSPDRSDDGHDAGVHLYQDHVAVNEGGIADADDDAGEGDGAGMSKLMADDDRDAVGPRPPPPPLPRSVQVIRLIVPGAPCTSLRTAGRRTRWPRGTMPIENSVGNPRYT